MSDQNAKFFYNTFYSRELIELLLSKSDNIKDFRECIAIHIFPNEEERDDSKLEIYQDFICELFRFAYERRFCLEKISTLFSIMHHVFNKSLDEKMTGPESFDMCFSIFKRHVAQFEPFSIGIFDEKDLEEIIKYLRNNFYKLYSLYDHNLTKWVDYNIYTHQPGEEKWDRNYASLEKGEIVEAYLIPQLEQYCLPKDFYSDTGDKMEEIEEDRKKMEEDRNINTTPMKKTEEEERLEQEVEEHLQKYKNELKLKIEKSNERVLGQVDELLKKKK